MAKEKDLKEPNLYVGKIIKSIMLSAEVVSFDDNNIIVRVLENDDKYMKRYVDVGKEYPLVRDTYWRLGGNILVWEIKPKSLKRNVSQVLLQWETEIGWTWDLDM